MTAAQRQHLFNVVLIEIVAAFVVVMVTLIAMFATGRLDGPYRGTVVCEASASCERLLEP